MKKRLLIGALAGLAGAQAMQWFRTWWNSTHTAGDGVFGLDREADVNSIQFLASWFSVGPIEDKKAEHLALAFHYLYGAAAGSAYALAVEQAPWFRSGFGMLFGAAVWVIGDEVPITALGVSNRLEKNLKSHSSALVAHVVFGVIVNAAVRVMW